MYRIDLTVDHTGPMTATVADNALLLEVLASPDGLDPRHVNVKTAAYTNALHAHQERRFAPRASRSASATLPGPT